MTITTTEGGYILQYRQQAADVTGLGYVIQDPEGRLLAAFADRVLADHCLAWLDPEVD